MAMKLLETVSVTVATAPITITNIPGNAKDLLLLISARSTAGTDTIQLTINGTSNTTNWARRQIVGNGGSISSSSSTNSNFQATINDALNARADVYSSASFYFLNYAGSTNKDIIVDGVRENNAGTSNVELRLFAARWAVSDAITTISLNPGAGNFGTNSLIQLYQIS
jgi:hypothetical protein